MKLGKLMIAVLAIAFVWASLGAQASAANAPTTLNIANGEQATYAYYEFGSNTQINIERGGELIICTGYENFATLNADIDFLAAGSGTASIRTAACMGGSPTPPTAKGITINGDITLHADGSIRTTGATATINGGLTANGFNLAVSSLSGGRVMGSGRVGSVSLDNGSSIAPGNSPGILNTGNLTFVSGSTYEFEIGGTTVGTEYDQINVTGTVDLGSGTLQVILYNGFKPTVGQVFTIIANDGADAVVGTFAGLAEGATFTVDGVTYRITYVGGNGNDVQLTVAANAPDTGFMLLMSNPFVTSGIMIFAAGAIVLLVRKYGKVSVRR